MVSLIDTNVLIRFFVKDHEEHYAQSVAIFEKIKNDTIKVELLSEVVMEVIFILTKFYKVPLADVVKYLSITLRLPGIVNKDKFILIEALDTMLTQRIDYVDALICAKSKLEGYGKISFDNDVLNKCD